MLNQYLRNDGPLHCSIDWTQKNQRARTTGIKSTVCLQSVALLLLPLALQAAHSNDDSPTYQHCDSTLACRLSDCSVSVLPHNTKHGASRSCRKVDSAMICSRLWSRFTAGTTVVKNSNFSFCVIIILK